MSPSPGQQRKKAMAMQEALRHQRYAQADGSMKASKMPEENAEEKREHGEPVRMGQS